MKTEIEILNSFFDRLNSANILFCVLRNYDEIPDNIGHDVDLLIQKEREQEAQEILVCILCEKGWKYREIWNKDGFKTIVYYGMVEGVFKQLKLDIWASLNWRGLPWIDTEYILNNTKKYKNFYIPTIGCESAVSMLKELMGGGDVPLKYVPVIERGVSEEWEHFRNSVDGTLLEEHVICIKECVDKKDWDSITKFAPILKKGILRKAKKERRIKFHYAFLIRESIFRIQSRVQRGGALVAFIGPDGSGKSTIIDRVSNKFKLIYPYQKVYHTRFELLPELRSGLGLSNINKKQPEDKKVVVADEKVVANDNQESQSMISKIVSWIVLCYYTFEFFLGKLIFFRINRKGRLVLFDRFYYDFFVQPKTRNLVWGFKKFLFLFVPKPDIIIHLYADGETVFARKGELNVAEIDLQNSLFAKLLQGDCRYNIFDTGVHNVDELVEKIAEVMYNKVL